MIRATAAVRALVLPAAFAAALTPVTCLGQNSKPLPARATEASKPLPPRAPENSKQLPARAADNSKPLPAKATKELPPELLSLLRQKKMPKQ